MNWIQRKIYLYNVTFGLYMLDWWERYLFTPDMLLNFARAMQALPSGKVNTLSTVLVMLLKAVILKIEAGLP